MGECAYMPMGMTLAEIVGGFGLLVSDLPHETSQVLLGQMGI